MKKILSILGVVSLITTWASDVIACKKEKTSVDNNFLEKNNDLEIWNTIQKKVVNNFLNQMTKEKTVFEINNSKLYSKVSNAKESIDIEKIEDTESNLVRQIIISNLTKINNEIKNEYSNFYYNYEPIKIKQDTGKFTINYIDPQAYSIIKNIPINETNNIKAINIKYDLQFELNYKKTTNVFNHIFDFIFTTNKNFILDKISKSVNYIKEKINKFCKNEINCKIKYDNQNNQLKDSFNDFSIFNNTANTNKIINNYIKQKFIHFLNREQKKDNKDFPFKINNTFLVSKTDDELDIFNLWNDFINKNNKNNWNEDILAENLVSNWLFNSNNDIKNNGNDFSSLYYNENKINDELKINSFAFNLNSISIYGLPLINELLNNNKVNIYITKQWFKDKIKEFGNLIYEFFKYFNTKLNDDKTITLNVGFEIFNKLDNKNINYQRKSLDLLMKQFKKDKPGLVGQEYFNWIIYNSHSLIPTVQKNNKIFFNSNSKSSEQNWLIFFEYGYNINVFRYIPFGGSNEKANFYIEKNNQ